MIYEGLAFTALRIYVRFSGPTDHTMLHDHHTALTQQLAMLSSMYTCNIAARLTSHHRALTSHCALARRGSA
jgi:hypothetical protein